MSLPPHRSSCRGRNARSVGTDGNSRPTRNVFRTESPPIRHDPFGWCDPFPSGVARGHLTPFAVRMNSCGRAPEWRGSRTADLGAFRRRDRPWPAASWTARRPHPAGPASATAAPARWSPGRPPASAAAWRPKQPKRPCGRPIDERPTRWLVGDSGPRHTARSRPAASGSACRTKRGRSVDELQRRSSAPTRMTSGGRGPRTASCARRAASHGAAPVWSATGAGPNPCGRGWRR